MPSSPIKTGVIGYPVKHSLSPLIHNYWIEKYNLAGNYRTFEISPDNFESEIQALIEQGIQGFNVTIPHKEHIMTLCDVVDETAQAIGAINTVSIKNGSLYGSNTDAFGFIENIKKSVEGFDFKNKSALIIGAGGAARAVAYGLRKEGMTSLQITNRTAEKAKTLAHDFDLDAVDWNQKENALADCTLLINTTSLGMTGQPDLAFDLSSLPSESVIYDIVYKPLYTDLLQQAQSRGNTIITGIGMLLHQARPAFEKWYGVMPDVTAELEEQILEASKV